MTTISLSLGSLEKSEPRGIFTNGFTWRALNSAGVRTSINTLLLSFFIALSCSVEMVVTPFTGLIRQMKNKTIRRSEEHTSELQSRENLVCRLLLEKKKKRKQTNQTI